MRQNEVFLHPHPLAIVSLPDKPEDRKPVSAFAHSQRTGGDHLPKGIGRERMRVEQGPERWARRLKGEERHSSSRSLGQPLRGLDFSAEEFLVEWRECSLDHDGVEVLEDLQLFHMLAAQAPELPFGWQLRMG
jgi:hypothetical protein